jgi:hypothetical protein
MSDLKHYIILVLKAGFERWDRGEFIVTLILAFIPVIATVFFGLKLEFTTAQWLLWVVLALVFDVAVIIPIKIGIKYIHITTTKLKVELESQPQNIGNQTWWHLMVSNPSNIPIPDCYGQVIYFTPNISNNPYKGMNLAWSTSGSTNTKSVTIPGKSAKLLDLVMTDHNNIYIVGLSPQSSMRSTYYPEPPGTYEAEIQVGSESESFEPTLFKIKIILDGHGNLDVQQRV